MILTEGVYGCMDCGTAVRAEDALWTAEFFVATEEVANPLCPACVDKLLHSLCAAAEEDLEECGLYDVGVGVIYDYWLDEFAEYLRNRRLRSPRESHH